MGFLWYWFKTSWDCTTFIVNITTNQIARLVVLGSTGRARNTQENGTSSEAWGLEAPSVGVGKTGTI